MRDRLIELIINADTYDSYECKLCNKDDDACDCCYAEKLADKLLANGVIVPPVLVGQTIYFLGGISGKSIKSATVEEIIINDDGVRDLLVTTENGVTFEDSIETFYLTREEAERALKKESEKE